MGKIYLTFMRHGWSLADDEKVHEGCYDSPLTNKGESQVKKRAQYFLDRNISFDIIIASPLKRASKTAEIISKKLDIPIQFEEDWLELDNGPVAGMSFEEAEQIYPEPKFRNPYEAFCQTGESSWQAYARASRGVENIIRQGQGSYLVVAHGGIINSAIKTIVGATPSANNQGIVFALGDTGFAQFVYMPDKHIWVLYNLERGY